MIFEEIQKGGGVKSVFSDMGVSVTQPSMDQMT